MSGDAGGPGRGDSTGLDVDYPRALLVVLAVALLLALVVAGTSSAASFGTYNGAWDGAAGLRAVAEDAGTEHEVVRNVTRYAEVPPEGTVAVVLSPERRYTDAETARLRAFVRDGGTLVVAEDFGANGSPLLAGVGARTRFDGALVRDERSNWRSPEMPVAPSVAADPPVGAPYVEGVPRLTLNRGTALVPGENATVLVRASEFAYLDADGDGGIGDDETLAAHPVVAVESVGDGRVLAVSDPSLFINAMLDRTGNDRFVRNVLGSGDRVLLDYSHATVPPLSVALLVLRSTPALQFLLGVAVLGVVAAWGRGTFGRVAGALGARVGRGRDPGPVPVDTEALVAHLERRHPEWDADRVRRVAQGVLSGRGERREDE